MWWGWEARRGRAYLNIGLSYQFCLVPTSIVWCKGGLTGREGRSIKIELAHASAPLSIHLELPSPSISFPPRRREQPARRFYAFARFSISNLRLVTRWGIHPLIDQLIIEKHQSLSSPLAASSSLSLKEAGGNERRIKATI